LGHFLKEKKRKKRKPFDRRRGDAVKFFGKNRAPVAGCGKNGASFGALFFSKPLGLNFTAS
jgi:hypothetical protein